MGGSCGAGYDCYPSSKALPESWFIICECVLLSGWGFSRITRFTVHKNACLRPTGDSKYSKVRVNGVCVLAEMGDTNGYKVGEIIDRWMDVQEATVARWITRRSPIWIRVGQWTFLCGICMLYPCQCGFSPGAPLSQSTTSMFRPTGESKWPLACASCDGLVTFGTLGTNWVH